ncbi:MAG: hypothetical protein HGB29_05290 [Chlorobiaceae bacterium]|jgi:hypothetical protein|nr:hypothetical protein [Chlorobiaceae bacterium]NTW74262.1 hypothetical protein [Chlorobiaceae bacterium]
MNQTLLHEKYPIYILELEKSETSCRSVDDIIAYYGQNIDAHPIATCVGVFDHYSHTSALSDGNISDDILAAKNIVFCFGKEIMNPKALAIRPKSIGVAELVNSFIISFLEAPNPAANEAMESWTLALKDR